MYTRTLDNLPWAARQLLEHYHRSGIVAIPRGTDRFVHEWAASSPLPAPLPPIPIPASEIHSQASPRPSPRKPREKPVEVVSSEAEPMPQSPSSPRTNLLNEPASIRTPWPGPALVESERQTRFESLRNEVAACRKCEELACTRKQTVFGVGNLTPRVVLFGEAPGADEDRQGEPFVGAAGQLLNKIIHASHMKREDLYILNSLKCRPPGNRTPFDVEIENCRPFFEAQLDALRPEFIVCLGAIAVRAVLKTTESIGRLRGRFHPYHDAQVLVTYHPAYLLRNEEVKKMVWEDMKMLMKAMGIVLD